MSIAFPSRRMEDCFNDMLLGRGEGSGWRQHREVDSVRYGARQQRHYLGRQSHDGHFTAGRSFPSNQGRHSVFGRRGRTPLPHRATFDSAIACRCMARQKAIVLGQFTGIQVNTPRQGIQVTNCDPVVARPIKTPILTNLPYGHVAAKILLPVGSKADLVTEEHDALLFWGHNPFH